MKTTMALVLAFVMLAVGGCIGFYFGATQAGRSALALATTSTPVAGVTASGVGKFQIVSGEYLYNSGNSGSPRRGVFKVNTETGESELFREFVDDKGGLKLFWDKIE